MRQQRQQIIEIWRHLRQWADASPLWSERFEQTISQTLQAGLAHLQIEQQQLQQHLQGGIGKPFYQYAFEKFSCEYCPEEQHSFIECYLQQNAAAISAFALAYCEQLNIAPLRLWSVQNVTATGEIWLFPTDSTNSADEAICVQQAGGNSGDYLLARVVTVDGHAYCGATALALAASEGKQVHQLIQSQQQEMIRYFEQAGKDEQVALSGQHLQQFTAEVVSDDAGEIAFNLWLAAVCREAA